METAFQFETRSAKAGDVPYILATWLRSARDSSLTRGMDDADYWPFMRSICVRLMSDPIAIARVATAPDDTDTILGWAVSSGSQLHFVYVRRDFRGNGIARELVPTGTDAYSLKTPAVKSIPKSWKYRPSGLCIF